MVYFDPHFHTPHEHTEHSGCDSDPFCGFDHFDPRLPSPYAQALAGLVSVRQLGAGGRMAVLGHM
eukprot:2238930-Alexandrium_andersonii.AAC.1